MPFPLREYIVVGNGRERAGKLWWLDPAVQEKDSIGSVQEEAMMRFNWAESRSGKIRLPVNYERMAVVHRDMYRHEKSRPCRGGS